MSKRDYDKEYKLALHNSAKTECKLLSLKYNAEFKYSLDEIEQGYYELKFYTVVEYRNLVNIAKESENYPKIIMEKDEGSEDVVSLSLIRTEDIEA